MNECCDINTSMNLSWSFTDVYEAQFRNSPMMLLDELWVGFFFKILLNYTRKENESYFYVVFHRWNWKWLWYRVSGWSPRLYKITFKLTISFWKEGRYEWLIPFFKHWSVWKKQKDIWREWGDIEKRNILVYYCLQNILIAIVSYETNNSVNAIVIPILQMKTLRLRV